MKTRLVAIPLLVLFVCAIVAPTIAHKADSPDCAQLNKTAKSAITNWLYKYYQAGKGMFGMETNNRHIGENQGQDKNDKARDCR